MFLPSFEITGTGAINKAVKQLGETIAKKALRKGARAGAKSFATELKQNVPVDTGNLKKQIKVRAGKRKRNVIQVLATTGDAKAKNLNSGKGFYGGFIEYGTKLMTAKPFIVPSFNAAKAKAEKVTVETIVSETNKLLP